MIAVSAMTAFHLGLSNGDAALASTMAFSTLTLARLLHGFNCRSEHSILKIGFKGNMASVGAFFAGIAFLLMVLFVPVLRRLFAVSVLSIGQIGMIVLLALIPTIVIQFVKVINEKRA